MGEVIITDPAPVQPTVVIEGSGSGPEVPPRARPVRPIGPGESPMDHGTDVHQEFPRVMGEAEPNATGQFNTAPGQTGPDFEPNASSPGNYRYTEMKSLWGRQGPMCRQARKWGAAARRAGSLGFDAQQGRYFFYDRFTGAVFEGIIQTEKLPSGKFR